MIHADTRLKRNCGINILFPFHLLVILIKLLQMYHG